MSLTAVIESLVRSALMVEIDPDIAAVWHTILNGRGTWLADGIATFQLTPESVRAVLEAPNRELHERAFATIVRNRISRGGILAPGAGIVKEGENGKGLLSRWYPDTLRRRILDIVAAKDRIGFLAGDGVKLLRDCQSRADAVFFIDPPYVCAGRRLYTYCEMDHAGLFEVVAGLSGDFLMTYDSAPEIRMLADKHRFAVREIPMKNTHHCEKRELLISRNLNWVDAWGRSSPASHECDFQMSAG